MLSMRITWETWIIDDANHEQMFYVCPVILRDSLVSGQAIMSALKECYETERMNI